MLFWIFEKNLRRASVLKYFYVELQVCNYQIYLNGLHHIYFLWISENILVEDESFIAVTTTREKYLFSVQTLVRRDGKNFRP